MLTRVENIGTKCFLCGASDGFAEGDLCSRCGGAKGESALAHLLVKYAGGEDRSLREAEDCLKFRRILKVGSLPGIESRLRGLALYTAAEEADAASGLIAAAKDGAPFELICSAANTPAMADALRPLLADTGTLIVPEIRETAYAAQASARWEVYGERFAAYHRRVLRDGDYTGERFMPGVEDDLSAVEHLQRYRSVRKLVNGLRVLDLACGEGYGSALLAETAAEVVGVDIDQPTVDRAQHKYGKANLRYAQGDARAIPLPDRCVDAVVSFETIEHITEETQQLFLAEIARVLTEDGLLIMSTPNKAVYSDRNHYFNEFHLHEFYEEEFLRFLKQYFPYVHIYQQSFQVVSLLSSCEQDSEHIDWNGNRIGPAEAKYLIAVASRKKWVLPDVSSLFMQTAGAYDAGIQRILALQNEETLRNIHIQKLDGEIREQGARIADLQEETVARGDHIQELDRELQEKNERITDLQKENAARGAHIQELDAELQEKGAWIVDLQDQTAARDVHIQAQDAELQEKGRLIVNLQEETAARGAHIQELDAKLQEKGTLIVNLQEENRAQSIHIEKLDQELGEKGERIRLMQKETEDRNVQIQKLEGELDAMKKLISELEALKQQLASARNELDQTKEAHAALLLKYDKAVAERNHMEEQRNTLVKERDELKGYWQQLTKEVEKLKETNSDLSVELNNKKGHIELLLESDRELERIHQTRLWRFQSFVRRIRDRLLPQNSRRRLVAQLAARFLRSPIGFLRLVDREHIDKFMHGLKTGNIASTSARMDNYLGGPTVNGEKMNILPTQEYVKREDVPTFNVPSSNRPVVSIVIPVYNQFHYTYACLKSIALNSGDIPFEVIIANDCSTDLTTQLTKIVSGVRVVTTKENLRFLRNCNNAAKHAKGRYILFLNNDTQVQKDWLAPLVELIERDKSIGMVGSKLVYPDGRLQEAGGILWKDGSAWNYGRFQDPALPEFNYVKEADFISGAAIMIRKTLWEEIGGFDDRYAPAYCEDSDLAFEVRRHGYKVMFQPASVVIHFEGVSNGTDLSSGQKAYQVANQKKFYEKWKDVLEKDHFPNAENVFQARDRSRYRNTVLVIDHYIPTYDKDAGSRTVDQYVRLLVDMGFNVKLLGDNFYHDVHYAKRFEQWGVEILYGVYYRDNWQRWVEENKASLTAVFMTRPHVTVKYIDFFKTHTDARIVYYGQDLHYLRERREYELTHDEKLLKSSEQWKKQEIDLMQKSDVVFTISCDEKKIINQDLGEDKAVISPIFYYDEFPGRKTDLCSCQDLLFVGGFTHHPNEDGVLWFIESIWPKLLKKGLDCRFIVVGSNPSEKLKQAASDRIQITGYIPDEELEKYYEQCRLCVIPLRFGAGVKGKTIEAMYHQIPIVSTSIGIEGLEGIDEYITAADDADAFADRVMQMYRNPTDAERKAARYGEYLERHFSYASARLFFEDVFGEAKRP